MENNNKFAWNDMYIKDLSSRQVYVPFLSELEKKEIIDYWAKRGVYFVSDSTWVWKPNNIQERIDKLDDKFNILQKKVAELNNKYKVLSKVQIIFLSAIVLLNCISLFSIYYK